MRLLVTGSRDCADKMSVWEPLDRFHASHGPITVLIEGGQRKRNPEDKSDIIGGVDYWAEQWAICRGVEVITEEALWTAQGRAAGPIRNARMIALHKPEACLRWPGGVGTADCAAKAKAAGIPVYRVS